MFRTVASVICLATVVIIVVHFLCSVVASRGTKVRRAHLRMLSFWQILAYLILLAGAGLMALNAYVPTLLEGIALRGWQLVFHCVAAPVFAGGLLLVVLTWSGKYAFFSDYKRLHMPADAQQTESYAFQVGVVSKFWFWTVALAGFVVIASMMLSMLPLFGTEQMELLLDAHRYSSLLVVAALVIHLYTLFRPARVVALSKD